MWILALGLIVISLCGLWISSSELGVITIECFNYHIEISIIFAVVTLLAFLLAIFISVYLIVFFKNIPGSLRKYYQEKQDHNDLMLLINAFASLYNQEQSQIDSLVKKLNKSKNHTQIQLLKPFLALLNIQANKLDLSRVEVLEGFYQEALQYESTKLVALKGLVLLRMKSQSYRDALSYAEKAIELQPNSREILNNLLEIYTELGMYKKAEYVIEKCLNYKFFTKKDANVLLAKNYLLHANDLITHNFGLEEPVWLLEKALKIEPSYYDALVILSRIYGQNQQKQLAYKIIEKAWKNLPSMSIAKLMFNVSQDEPLNKRVKLLENLISAKVDNPEGYLVLTKLYIKENMLTQARATMDKLLAIHAPDYEACKLMSLIESKSHSSHTAIINWLNRI